MSFDVVSASASAWKTNMNRAGRLKAGGGNSYHVVLQVHSQRVGTGMQSGDTPCSWSST